MQRSRTSDSICEVVINRKPSLMKGQDRRDLPTYSIWEAATYLGIPKRTANFWFDKSNPILTASGRSGSRCLLSFYDLTEAYVLALLTKYYRFPLAKLRLIIRNAKEETGFARPLIEANLKVVLGKLILDNPGRGKQGRQAVDMVDGNLVFPEFVDQLGRRIIRDSRMAPLRIFPWRLVEGEDDSRPVTMDPDIHSGRLVVTGTRIPVTVLFEKFKNGRTEEDLANSYQITPDAVRKALAHIGRPVHKKAA